jgi:hypothetical protein
MRDYDPPRGNHPRGCVGLLVWLLFLMALIGFCVLVISVVAYWRGHF